MPAVACGTKTCSSAVPAVADVVGAVLGQIEHSTLGSAGPVATGEGIHPSIVPISPGFSVRVDVHSLGFRRHRRLCGWTAARSRTIMHVQARCGRPTTRRTTGGTSSWCPLRRAPPPWTSSWRLPARVPGRRARRAGHRPAEPGSDGAAAEGWVARRPGGRDDGDRCPPSPSIPPLRRSARWRATTTGRSRWSCRWPASPTRTSPATSPRARTRRTDAWSRTGTATGGHLRRRDARRLAGHHPNRSRRSRVSSTSRPTPTTVAQGMAANLVHAAATDPFIRVGARRLVMVAIHTTTRFGSTGRSASPTVPRTPRRRCSPTSRAAR